VEVRTDRAEGAALRAALGQVTAAAAQEMRTRGSSSA
jgi:hypothetical protein